MLLSDLMTHHNCPSEQIHLDIMHLRVNDWLKAITLSSCVNGTVLEILVGYQSMPYYDLQITLECSKYWDHHVWIRQD